MTEIAIETQIATSNGIATGTAIAMKHEIGIVIKIATGTAAASGNVKENVSKSGIMPIATTMVSKPHHNLKE
jgi:hypothetical protein